MTHETTPPVRILADELLTELDAETSEQPTVFGFTVKEAAQTSATTLRREQAQEALPTRVAEMEELLVQFRQFAMESRPTGKIMMMRKAAMIERIDTALQRSKQEALHG
ncbi:hypothetical protein [Azotobacter beijerinckii]|uniref:hypothetical protein n=1 Tax=Azotobacter beijerinckii TaxID=170623 RepID=UPI002953152A|nr:hypothetical protein [Azotobacter beijerinckii]MDV7209960.1 hypothetical protein [Azotobacter beijerinckii]